MARYTGPVCKLCRREGMKLMLKATDVCRRNALLSAGLMLRYARTKRARKLSDYGLQLREKQKARRIYGIVEKQFRKHYDEAQRRPGVTGENLLQILEMRLDNVVYRLGFADSRSQARQLVRHGHFNVNGRKTDVPSFLTKIGDTIILRDNSRGKEYFKVVGEEIRRHDVPTWLNLDITNLSGRIVSVPQRTEIDATMEEQLIVEYYSR